MGNDGGSIPKRRELAKSVARGPTHSELKATTLESQGHAWTHDPLTSAPLDLDAVVSDWQGRLYNYESILQNLMPSDAEADARPEPPADSQVLTFASTGIKSLRDIVKLKLAKSGEKRKDKQDVRVCPVSMKELGPGTRTVYLVPCGHVFAEIAIKQIQDDACPECSEPFKSENVVLVLPNEEADVQKLVQRMDNLRAAGLTHGLKKDKSAGKKKRKAEEVTRDNKNDTADERRATGDGIKVAKKEKSSGINNAMAASLTARVMAEQEELSKRRKMTAKA